jgi:hypothetical protein
LLDFWQYSERITMTTTDSMVLGSSGFVILSEHRDGKMFIKALSTKDTLPLLQPVVDYGDHTHPWFSTYMMNLGDTQSRGIVAVVDAAEDATLQGVLFEARDGQRCIEVIEIALDRELGRATELTRLVRVYLGLDQQP